LINLKESRIIGKPQPEQTWNYNGNSIAMGRFKGSTGYDIKGLLMILPGGPRHHPPGQK
jgi:hypothetical protein